MPWPGLEGPSALPLLVVLPGDVDISPGAPALSARARLWLDEGEGEGEWGGESMTKYGVGKSGRERERQREREKESNKGHETQGEARGRLSGRALQAHGLR